MITETLTDVPAKITVGKINGDSTPHLSALILPESFAWLAEFEPDEIAQFLSELMAAIRQADMSGDWQIVLNLIEAWQETAELLADPEHKSIVAEARAQYRAGEVISAEEVLAEYTMLATPTLDGLITKNPDLRGGRPILAGTGVTVRTIAGYYKMGLTPEEVADQMEVPLASVYAALTYYHLNKVEIEADLAAHAEEALLKDFGIPVRG